MRSNRGLRECSTRDYCRASAAVVCEISSDFARSAGCSADYFTAMGKITQAAPGVRTWSDAAPRAQSRLSAAQAATSLASRDCRVFLIQDRNPANVDSAPDAARTPRREADLVAVLVYSPADPVDPANAQGLLYRLLPGNARTAGLFLEESDPEELGCRVVLPEPEAQVGGRAEERHRARGHWCRGAFGHQRTVFTGLGRGSPGTFLPISKSVTCNPLRKPSNP